MPAAVERAATEVPAVAPAEGPIAPARPPTAEMFVPILVLVFIGVVLTSQMKTLQIWLSPWKESERDQGA
jgi:hypothetical protein